MNTIVIRMIGVGLLLQILHTGCGAYGPKFKAPERQTVTSVAELLQYFQYANTLTPAELNALYIEEEQTFVAQEESSNMLRLALLLTLQNTQFQNTSQASDLFTKYMTQDQANDELSNFCSLLIHILSEQEKKETIYNTIKQKLDRAIAEKDKNAKQYKQAKQQLDYMRLEVQKQQETYKKVDRELTKEREMVKDLRQQIEQLKSIEKNLHERQKKSNPST